MEPKILMKTAGQILKVLVVLVLSLNRASAQGRNPDSTQTAGKSMRTPGMNYILTHPGSVAELKRSITEVPDIQFEEGSKLQWPPVPRAWLEYATTDYMSSNTFLGFKMSPSLFGFSSVVASKLSFDFRYQVKTSFVVIAAKEPLSELDHTRKMFQFDENMKTYLNVAPNVPMVGLCIFEAYFALDKGKTLNFEYLGSGQSINQGKIESMTNTHFSPFFQIKTSDQNSVETARRSILSIDAYQKRCAEIYKQKIEAQVTTEFSQQIMSFVFHNHPKSQCQPDPGPAAPEGDASCMNWFEENFNSTTKKLTVPRCTLMRGGVHVCTPKAKSEGVSCPMYLNSDRSYSDQPVDSKSRKVSTRDAQFPAYPCDQDLGLSCQLEKEPLFIGNIPITKATARCQKTK